MSYLVIPLCMAFYCLGALTVSLPVTIALIAEQILHPPRPHPAQPDSPTEQ